MKLILLLAAAAFLDSTAQSTAALTTIRLEKIGEGFRNPVYVTSPPGDNRLFVVEQAGRIRVMKNGRTLPVPFLDIASSVSSGGEWGMRRIERIGNVVSFGEDSAGKLYIVAEDGKIYRFAGVH